MIGAVRSPHEPGLRDEVRLRVHGLDLRVRSDVPAVLDTVAASYAAFRVVDPASDRDTSIRIEMWSTAARDATAAVLGTLDQVVMQVIDGLGAEGILGTHAAAVALDDDRAVVLAGRSGAGKSTLALALLRDGAGLLTDELTLIDRDDRTILPYPRAIHVSPATVDLLPELGFLRERQRQALGAELEWAVSTDDVARAFGATVAGPTRLAAIVILDQRGDPADEPIIERITGAQAAMELSRGTPAAARDFAGTVSRLGSIAGSAPTFRLRATDLRRTAALLRDHLRVSA
jgi:hypothetical protein